MTPPRASAGTPDDEAAHRPTRYKNTRLERDRRGVKRRYSPLRGLGAFASAARSCASSGEQRQYFRAVARGDARLAGRTAAPPRAGRPSWPRAAAPPSTSPVSRRPQLSAGTTIAPFLTHPQRGRTASPSIIAAPYPAHMMAEDSTPLHNPREPSGIPRACARFWVQSQDDLATPDRVSSGH
jgi:hypothetical protein